MSLPPLYPFQQRAIDGVKHAYGEGARRIVLVLPTGAGKTRTSTEIVGGAIRKGRRVLFLAHRGELVSQASESMSRLGVDHGVVMAGRPASPHAPIQVASVQTLVARPDSLPPTDIIVVDECHHAVAATWHALLGRYPTPELILGLTATPERGDRKPLGESSGGVFQKLVSVTSVGELQRTLRPDGHPILVPCRVVGPAQYQDELFRAPIDGLLEFGRNAAGKLRPSILFAGSVEESTKIAGEANARGIRAAAVDGSMKPSARKAALDAFASREIDLLVNVFVLTEGFDVPATEVCAIARGCAAVSTFMQMVGRALRSSPSSGKRDALLIDYRGLSHVHGLVDEERTFSLDGRAISRAEKIRLQQCVACGAVFAPAAKCPGCGTEMPRMARSGQKVRRTEAVSISRDNVTPTATKRAFFDRVLAEAQQKGWKPGAVGMRFRARFGHWPQWRIPGQRGAA